MENIEKVEKTENTVVSVELSKEQFAFLTGWKKSHEAELGIEVPMGAMVRKAVEGAMKAGARKEESSDARPSFGDRPRPSFGGGRPSGGGDRPRPSGDRPSFGDRPRPSFGGGDRGAPRTGGFSPRPPFKR